MREFTRAVVQQSVGICCTGTESGLMLVTVVYLMYQTIVWLRQWRSSVRCMRLICEHLHQSSVIMRPTTDRSVSYDELSSRISDGGHVASTSRVLWTHGSQQLAVMMPQVKLTAFMLIRAGCMWIIANSYILQKMSIWQSAIFLQIYHWITNLQKSFFWHNEHKNAVFGRYGLNTSPSMHTSTSKWRMGCRKHIHQMKDSFRSQIQPCLVLTFNKLFTDGPYCSQWWVLKEFYFSA